MDGGRAGRGAIGVYTVSVRTDIGPLQLWLSGVTATSANFNGGLGYSYTPGRATVLRTRYYTARGICQLNAPLRNDPSANGDSPTFDVYPA